MRAVQLVFALMLTSSALMAQIMTTSEAAKHVGERETVCGTIAGEHTAASSRGTPTFINLDRAYANVCRTLLCLPVTFRRMRVFVWAEVPGCRTRCGPMIN